MDEGRNAPVALISDSTGAKCEFMVNMKRYVDDVPNSPLISVQERILDVALTDEHHDGIKAAGTTTRILVTFGIAPADVYFTMRDTVAMNGVMDMTLRQLGGFARMFSILCFLSSIP